MLKYEPMVISPNLFINLLALTLATISPALKNIIAKPPKKRGAPKSFVNQTGDQSIIIPNVAKFIINKNP